VSVKHSDFPRVIFTLTSARSGTLYLRDLFRSNVRDCACRHEPFFDWGNPTLFGPAIYDALAGRLDRIRARLARKREYILRLGTGAYMESSHAFLKSAYLAALEFFPEMGLIHLIRDPLLVAKSEAVREERRRAAYAPFHYYKGDDGRRHFWWALTGNEEIYKNFEGQRLSLLQKYIIQWIEIENRAMSFLEQHGLGARCFTMGSPGDLASEAKIRQMFEFFGLKTRQNEIVLGGRRNASLGYKAVVDAKDQGEFEQVLARLPAAYLDIFQHEPYRRFEWNARLRAAANPSATVLQNVA
jgi:hypothetical protein